MICPHAASGCNYPEGECDGLCMNKGENKVDEQEQAKGAQEPIMWLFQHKETGRPYAIEANLASDFRKINPRYIDCGPLYTRPAKPVQPASELTDLQADITACLRFTTAQANQIAELLKVNEQMLKALKRIAKSEQSLHDGEYCRGVARTAIAAAEAAKGGV